jgi:hypothetical protein
MPFVSLEAYVPEVVPREIRSVHVVEHGEIQRAYTFLELFCDEKGCDCRRVMFHVVSDERGARQPRATLSWGWEPDAFYRKWASFPLSAEDLEELRGPALARLAPQSEESSAMLAHLRTLLADEGYTQRVIRHYRLFRERVEQAPASELDAPRPNRAQRRAERAMRRARR